MECNIQPLRGAYLTIAPVALKEQISVVRARLCPGTLRPHHCHRCNRSASAYSMDLAADTHSRLIKYVGISGIYVSLILWIHTPMYFAPPALYGIGYPPFMFPGPKDSSVAWVVSFFEVSLFQARCPKHSERLSSAVAACQRE